MNAIKGLGLCATATAIATSALLWPTVIGAPGSEFVGNRSCFLCHIDLARQWAEATHSKALLKPDLAPEMSGCEACHGPGGDHVAGDRKDIVSWRRLSDRRRAEVCLKCHQTTVSKEEWQSSAHAKAKVLCDRCHEVHKATSHPALLRSPPNGICLECHADIVQKTDKLLHHKLMKGRLKCAVCHRPHGSAFGGMLIKDRQKLCADCHQEEVPQPPSHDTSVWKKAHGQSSKAGDPACNWCHGRDCCSDCHQTDMPHRKGWSTKPHGQAANEKPKVCERCHADPKDCAKCHDQDNMPQSHEAGAFRKDHGRLASGHEGLCSLCHGADSCNKCHGMPIPHPKGWTARDHPEALAKSPGSCQRCHDTKTCRKCHTDGDTAPEDHSDEGYVKSHGKASGARAAYCALCHAKQECDGCHKTKGVTVQNANR